MPWTTTDDATHHDDNTGKSLAGWRNETIDLHCTQGLVMDYGVWTASGDWDDASVLDVAWFWARQCLGGKHAHSNIQI
ncbi:hypothetical protein VTJ04DRAFT_8831 [Mycothermus thermophilus]|uniref:uncharacterized protein n=1 Tax=Humicola insolens TaxID=85995 RepID=UPI003743D63B